MAAPSSQARTPLRAKQSQAAKLTSQGVTMHGTQIFVTREGLQTVVKESAPNSHQGQDAGVLVLDAVEAEDPERSGSVQSAIAPLLHQNAPGQQ